MKKSKTKYEKIEEMEGEENGKRKERIENGRKK